MDGNFPSELQPIFRRMEAQDLDPLMAVEEVAFPTPWSRRTYERELVRSDFGSYWVGVPGVRNLPSAPKLLSYGGMWHTGNESHITTIAVHPRWRRRHIGVWTLLKLIVQARSKGAELITLEVRESNTPAIALYEKLGFHNVGVRRGYYMDTREDALLMTLFAIHFPENWAKIKQALREIEQPTDNV